MSDKDRADELRVRRLPLQEAKKEVLLNLLKTIRDIAAKHAKRFGDVVSFDELVSIGHLAIVEVQRTWRPELGSFETYGPYRAMKTMLDAIRKQLRYRHYVVPYSKACELWAGMEDPADPLHDTDETICANLSNHSDELMASVFNAAMVELWSSSDPWAVDERLAFEEARAALHGAVSELPAQEQRLLGMFYAEDAKTLEEIGPELGWSYAKVRRRHKEILASLAEKLRKLGATGATNEEAAKSDSGASGASAPRDLGNVRWLRRGGHGR